MQSSEPSAAASAAAWLTPATGPVVAALTAAMPRMVAGGAIR